MMKDLNEQDEQDEIDRILKQQDEIVPSSGFASAVMDAVRREAMDPPPIPFPWTRALPGAIAGGVVVVMVLVAFVVVWAQPESAASGPQVSTFFTPSSVITPLQRDLKLATMWTIAGLLAALISVKISMRLPSTGI